MMIDRPVVEMLTG